MFTVTLKGRTHRFSTSELAWKFVERYFEMTDVLLDVVEPVPVVM